LDVKANQGVAGINPEKLVAGDVAATGFFEMKLQRTPDGVPAVRRLFSFSCFFYFSPHIVPSQAGARFTNKGACLSPSVFRN